MFIPHLTNVLTHINDLSSEVKYISVSNKDESIDVNCINRKQLLSIVFHRPFYFYLKNLRG